MIRMLSIRMFLGFSDPDLLVTSTDLAADLDPSMKMKMLPIV
jgi:hypothetical protein